MYDGMKNAFDAYITKAAPFKSVSEDITKNRGKQTSSMAIW